MPIWDQNKGNIIAAQAALVRAAEESHRVEVTLTNSLALAYEGYRNNLYAMEYYRRNVLPDLVRYYRGIFARRQIDTELVLRRPGVRPAELYHQRQRRTSASSAILWTSVVGVADFLQTDDLYQFKERRELPELPDFHHLQLPPEWACGHDTIAAPCPAIGAGVSPPAAPSGAPCRPPGRPASRRSRRLGAITCPLDGRPRAGTGGASPPPSGVLSAAAPPGPSAATGRAPTPPSDLEGRVTAWQVRARAAAIHPSAVSQSVLAEETNHEG